MLEVITSDELHLLHSALATIVDWVESVDEELFGLAVAGVLGLFLSLSLFLIRLEV